MVIHRGKVQKYYRSSHDAVTSDVDEVDED